MAYKVIDLNEHNASINFNALNVDAVILRVGYRSFSDAGNIKLDRKFKAYITACNDRHIPVGLYFQSQAISVSEAKEEAKYVLNKIKNYSVDLPIYINIGYAENHNGVVGRFLNAQIAKAKLTRIAQAFCDTIMINGYEAGVYCKYEFFKNKMFASDLKNCSLWVSYYSANGVPPLSGIEFDMWQFTDDAEAKGVTGMVNADCLYKDFIWRKYVADKNLICRSSAEYAQNNEGILIKGTEIDVLAGSEIANENTVWVKIRLGDELYYVAKEYLRRV